MADDLLINKAAFSRSDTRQDAAILNIQRACEPALDMRRSLVRRERPGVPQSSRDIFTLLAQAGWIEQPLAEDLNRKVGFRNIAVPEYQTLQLPIVIAVIEKHLDQFLSFTQSILLREASFSSRGEDR